MKTYSVFSNQIIERWVMCEEARTRQKVLKENIPDLVVCYNELLRYGYYMPQIILECPYSDDNIANECSYKLCTCAELRSIVSWIGANILNKLQTRNCDTCRVLLRIATDMLNKLYYDKVLTKQQNIYIHDNVVQNVLMLWQDLKTDDLPF